MLFIVIFIVAIFFWFFLVGARHKSKIVVDQGAEFTAAHKGWDIYISPYNRSVIAIGRETSEIVLGPFNNSRRYALREVASVEILRDGASVTLTNRGSQLAGAAIGGLALGGVGLLVGGLSGSKRNLATLHSVAIKVIVDDRYTPVHVIEFFKSPSSLGTPARSPQIKKSLETADRFHALLVNALRDQKNDAGPQVGQADELAKLWQLKQGGALTQGEFDVQKVRVLGNAEPRAIPHPASAERGCEVVLTGHDLGRKIALIKTLREITPGLMIIDALKFVDSAPQYIGSRLSLAEAEHLRDRIEAVGGLVEILVAAEVSGDKTGTSIGFAAGERDRTDDATEAS